MKLPVIPSGEPSRELLGPRRCARGHRGDTKVLKAQGGGPGLEELSEGGAVVHGRAGVVRGTFVVRNAGDLSP